MSHEFSQRLAGLALASLLSAGCGDGRPEIVPVSGQVLIDGKPLDRGFVRFLPNGSRASTGKIGGDGRFTLTCVEPGDGAVAGTHRVEVVASELTSATTMKWYVPKKYADSKASGVTFEISEPTSEAVIQLSWDGGKTFVETLGSGGKKQAGELMGGALGEAAKANQAAQTQP